MKYFNWINIRLILIFGLMIFLYSFTTSRNNARKLKKTEVIFIGESKNFIKQETVNKLLIENFSDIKTIHKVEVDLKKLEKSIDSQEMIKKSQVFLSVDGILKAEIEQRTPVGRIENVAGSFYIDNEGNTMSISDLFTARVPIVSGKISAENKPQIGLLLDKIQKDDFLKKNIIGMKILINDDVIMYNRNYNFLIDFGKIKKIDSKFNNYKAFYQKAFSEDVLGNYKTINLKFSNQVVCSK